MTKKETKSDSKSPRGLVKRPLYDPVIEQLNDKARSAAAAESADKVSVSDRTLQPGAGRTQGLRDHGARVNPDARSLNYMGSFAVHIYAHKRAPSVELLTLDTGGALSDRIGQEAAKALLAHIMTAFGKALPASLDPKKPKIIKGA